MRFERLFLVDVGVKKTIANRLKQIDSNFRRQYALPADGNSGETILGGIYLARAWIRQRP